MKKIVSALILVFAILGSALSQTWNFVPSPSPSETRNILRGVGAVGPGNVWAVGVYDTIVSGQTHSKSLTLNWNGISWIRVASPNPGSLYTELYDVQGFSANDVFAVGTFTTGPSTQTLAMRWNGSQWNVISTPFVQGGSMFECMFGFGPNDIYAGGQMAVGAPGPTTGNLIAHWNGSSWDVEDTPNQSNNRTNRIRSIRGLSHDDIWAAGYSRNIGENFRAMILHKTTSGWKIQTIPVIGDESFLYSIDVISASDIWATGEYNDNGTMKPLFMHYSGSAWSIVNSPGGGAATIHNASNDIWSVGAQIVHYDGVSWQIAPANFPPDPSLLAITRVSATEFWAVGRYQDSHLKTLTMRFGSGITSTGNTTGIPERFSLSHNYPNPFNPETVIKYSVSRPSEIAISVYNILGSEVAVLNRGMMQPGYYEAKWNASSLPSGIYMYTLKADGVTIDTKKMILVK